MSSTSYFRTTERITQWIRSLTEYHPSHRGKGRSSEGSDSGPTHPSVGSRHIHIGPGTLELARVYQKDPESEKDPVSSPDLGYTKWVRVHLKTEQTLLTRVPTTPGPTPWGPRPRLTPRRPDSRRWTDPRTGHFSLDTQGRNGRTLSFDEEANSTKEENGTRYSSSNLLF